MRIRSLTLRHSPVFRSGGRLTTRQCQHRSTVRSLTILIKHPPWGMTRTSAGGCGPVRRGGRRHRSTFFVMPHLHVRMLQYIPISTSFKSHRLDPLALTRVLRATGLPVICSGPRLSHNKQSLDSRPCAWFYWIHVCTSAMSIPEVDPDLPGHMSRYFFMGQTSSIFYGVALVRKRTEACFHPKRST